MFNHRKILIALMVTIILVAGTGFSAQPAQAANCSSYHVVRPGESLSWIARYYGAYWPYLAQINGIPAPWYTVYPGQQLCIAYGGNGYYPYNNNGYGNNGYGYPGTGGGSMQLTAPIGASQWSSVQKDANVTINTYNFPSNVMFNVKMGRPVGQRL